MIQQKKTTPDEDGVTRVDGVFVKSEGKDLARCGRPTEPLVGLRLYDVPLLFWSRLGFPHFRKCKIEAWAGL